ncbi:ADP-ribosylglycohydrolase family protein [Thermodesulfobacteriota bacterium]
MKKKVLISKFLGSMAGSAIGDAIGELAFMYPEEILLREVIDETGELRYTDDTAMAIGLAESIVKNQSIDQYHLGETFRKNYEREPWRGYASGPPTIFNLVKRKEISYQEAAAQLFSGRGSFGNGAAMRIAPAALFFSGSPDIYEMACASAQVTHAHPVGMDGAAMQAMAIARALRSSPDCPFHLESFFKELVDSSKTPEIKEKMVLVYRLVSEDFSPDVSARTIGQTVAVQESMPFAVYCFARYPASFEECIFCAVLNGGDRDTLGAMAGAISGAFLGVDAIPDPWLKRLENFSYVEELALKLVDIYKEKTFKEI